MCQDINHIQKKPKRKSVMPTEEFGLTSNVIIVSRNAGKNSLIIEEVKNIIARGNVKALRTVKCHSGNRPLIKELEKLANQNGFILQITGKEIQKEFHISKQGDMQGKNTQWVRTLWKNGKHLKESSDFYVLYVNEKLN